MTSHRERMDLLDRILDGLDAEEEDSSSNDSEEMAAEFETKLKEERLAMEALQSRNTKLWSVCVAMVVVGMLARAIQSIQCW